MSEQTPEPTADPAINTQDFHAQLDIPVYDLVEKSADQFSIETRESRGN